MKKKVKVEVLNIVVASPGDVQAERDAIEGVVTEVGMRL